MIRVASLTVGAIGLALFAFIYSGTAFTFWALLNVTPFAAGLLALGFIGLAFAPRAKLTPSLQDSEV